MSAGSPVNSKSSREDRSTGIVLESEVENPNIAFIQDRRKKVGPKRYRKRSKNTARRGKRSKKNEKNKNSETKNIEPGNPKNIKEFNSIIRNSLGHIKLSPLISVIRRVLNRRATASTSKNEFVERRAWLMSIQKLARIRFDWPLNTHIVSQCISTTVEYATSFFRST